MTQKEAIEELKKIDTLSLPGGYLGKMDEALKMAIKAMQTEQRWIPAGERLPKEDGEYLTSTEGYDVYLSWWDGKSFSCQDKKQHCEGEVIAWQKKPRPFWK